MKVRTVIELLVSSADTHSSVKYARTSRLDDPYFLSARRRTDTTKQREREKVLRHLLDHRDKAVHARMLTNPGAHWQFEHMVDVELGGQVKFVGVERDWPILEFGIQYMPGTDKQRMRFGQTRDERLCVATDKASVWWSELESFPEFAAASISHRALKGRKGIRRHINSFWIDLFGSCFTLKFARCFAQFPALFDPHATRIPYAITFQHGRERPEIPGGAFGTVEQRAEAIAAQLSSANYEAVPLSAWAYYGESDTRMATATGVIYRIGTSAHSSTDGAN